MEIQNEGREQKIFLQFAFFCTRRTKSSRKEVARCTQRRIIHCTFRFLHLLPLFPSFFQPLSCCYANYMCSFFSLSAFVTLIPRTFSSAFLRLIRSLPSLVAYLILLTLFFCATLILLSVILFFSVSLFL